MDTLLILLKEPLRPDYDSDSLRLWITIYCNNSNTLKCAARVLHRQDCLVFLPFTHIPTKLSSLGFFVGRKANTEFTKSDLSFVFIAVYGRLGCVCLGRGWRRGGEAAWS